MTYQSVLSALAGILFLGGFVPYVRAILKGETKPAKASWIIWASLDTITLIGMYVKGSVNGQILGAIIGAWIVVVLALQYGTPGWTKLDKFCLGGALFGIVLWQTFNSPTLGIVTSLSIVFLGSFPTFNAAWEHPEHEDKTAWTMYWLSCVCALAAIPAFTWQDAAQPITFTLIESTMMLILFVRPWFIEQFEDYVP